MANTKPTDPAQPDQIDRQDDDAVAPVDKNQKSDKAQAEVQPGADGFASADANEDTYD